MKRIVVLVSLVFLLFAVPITLQAKGKSIPYAQPKGTSLLGVHAGLFSGVGVGVLYDGIIADSLWKGSLSLGVKAACKWNVWGQSPFSNFGSQHEGIYNLYDNLVAIPILFRVAYRLQPVQNLEVYSGFSMGFSVHLGANYNYVNPVMYAGSWFVGLNYYFAKKVGLAVELDCGLPSTWLNVGFTFRL